MEREYIDLLTLQSTIKDGLEDLFPDKVWVRAEIAAVSVKANGHCYLELSQSGPNGLSAKAHAVIWRSKYYALNQYFVAATGSSLQAGMSVLVRVQVTYSELYGLTLTVDDLDPQFTLGEQELERRRTIARLEEEGLLDKQKELVPAELPYALAVVTARDAAGYGDFSRHLHGNEYGFVFRTDLFEATMQGQGAPASIVDALDRIESAPIRYDAVLILRGGGSTLDLSCFDDYGLCWRIAQCPVPVYTAIGHERDRHVADMVAYASVKTPTALADEFIDCFMAEDERIGSFSTRLRLAFLNKVNALASRVDLLEARIKSADPRAILKRGYVLAADARGRVLKSASGAGPGDRVSLLFADGTLDCDVKARR
jgi:exodeoxyribonuclease VII large subunit